MDEFKKTNEDKPPEIVKNNWNTFRKVIDNACKKICEKYGIDPAWEAIYKKDEWTPADARIIIERIDLMTIDPNSTPPVGVVESKKEDFLWSRLNELYPNGVGCEQIVYVDDSQNRLNSFSNHPSKFQSVSLHTIHAIPDQNNHFI